MADTPTFALNTVPGTVITLPSFEKSRTINATVAFIAFEGAARPRGFRSPRRFESWEITARFDYPNRDDAVSFMSMLDTAYDQTDARLRFTPGGMQTYAYRLVEIPTYTEEIEPVSGITRITFTATEVAT